MNTTRVQHKGQVTIPTRIREQAGLSKGDLVEFAFQRGTIVITPKIVVDRSGFASADKEYTAAQRRAIDARLDKADEDIKAGRVSAAFDTAAAFLADLHKARPARGAKKASKRSDR